MKKVPAFLILFALSAPLMAADTAERAPQLPPIDAGTILNQINQHPFPAPAPTTLDTCVYSGFEAGNCRFKCQSGALLTEPSTIPGSNAGCAIEIVRPIQAQPFKALTKADLNWKNISLASTDGARIIVDYASSFYDGNFTADPMWITVSSPRFTGGEKVRAVIMTYYENSYMAGKLKDTREVDLPYNGQAFQAKTGGVSIIESLHVGYGFNCVMRQEMAIVVAGRWLTDPANGTHNFRFQMSR